MDVEGSERKRTLYESGMKEKGRERGKIQGRPERFPTGYSEGEGASGERDRDREKGFPGISESDLLN